MVIMEALVTRIPYTLRVLLYTALIHGVRAGIEASLDSRTSISERRAILDRTETRRTVQTGYACAVSRLLRFSSPLRNTVAFLAAKSKRSARRGSEPGYFQPPRMRGFIDAYYAARRLPARSTGNKVLKFAELAHEGASFADADAAGTRREENGRTRKIIKSLIKRHNRGKAFHGS